MRRSIKILSVSCLVLVGVLSTLAEPISEIEVAIDASRSIGPVPELLTSSIWLHHLDDRNLYILNKFFSDNRPATIQLSLTLLQSTKNFDDYKVTLGNYLNSKVTSLLLQKTKEHGTRLIVGFDPCPMPAWLSSRPDDMRAVSYWGYTIQGCSPPKDYGLWGEVVQYTLQSFVNKGAQRLGLYVGHEQERDWVGDETSFFQYYEYAARSAKTVDKNIPVGGPGTGGTTQERLGCSSYPPATREICEQEGGWANSDGEPFIKNFIEYVASGGKEKTGGPVPLDFINWHHFTAEPTSVQDAARLFNQWLKQNRLGDVYLYPSDWSGWTWPPYPADYLDTTELGAFIPQALYHMWKSGIRWHGHDFNVFDNSQEKKIIDSRQGATFIGDWSLFTRHGAIGGGIIKPAYNVFKAFNHASRGDGKERRQLLQVNFPEDDSVAALSTMTEDGQKVFIIMSNYFPQKDRFLRYLVSRVRATTSKASTQNTMALLREWAQEQKAGKPPSAARSPQQKELLTFLTQARGCLSRNDMKECVRQTARGLKDPENIKISQVIGSSAEAAADPKTVRLNIGNLQGWRAASLISYRIDNNHANACSHNKKTEPQESNTPCGIGGAIDQAVWNAKTEATEKAEAAAEDELIRRGFTGEQIGALKRTIEECRENNINLRNCAEKAKVNDQARINLLAAYDTYQRKLTDIYYNLIDGVNNSHEVSMEGSQVNENASVSSGNLNIDVTMEPNSVVLIELEKNTQ